MIISAIVGAGFATGAELIAFFGTSALPPIAISVLIGGFLFVVMTAIIYIPKQFNKKIFAPAFFIFFVAMTAGITELVGPIASAAAVVTSILIVWFGFDKMLAANKVLMIFALAILAGLVAANLDGTVIKSDDSSGGWLSGALFALAYAGMNCCILPVIFQQAQKTLPRSDLMVCIFTASVAVSFLCLLILTAIQTNGVQTAAMPVLALSNSIIARIAVLICILTSMFATLFNLHTSEQKNALRLLCLGALGYICSFFGFTKIIGVFYPLVGIALIVYIIFLFGAWVWGLAKSRWLPATPVFRAQADS